MKLLLLLQQSLYITTPPSYEYTTITILLRC
jgi:hypothetical protein